MNIIIAHESVDRLNDGINAIIDLNETDFENVIQRLGTNSLGLEKIYFNYQFDGCTAPNNPVQIGLERKWSNDSRYISRDYYNIESHEIVEIFQKLAERQKDFQPNSIEYERISRILATRNLEKYKELELQQYSKELKDKAFSILENEEAYNKFLDYENNQEFFSIKGKTAPMEDYVKILGNTFGKINAKDEFTNLNNSIYKDFYIPNLDEYMQKYAHLYSEMNFDRFLDPAYKFDEYTMHMRYRDIYRIIPKGKEEDWTVNGELQNIVFQDMPEDLSTEEKAMYIYCKLCKELVYDDGYVFRRHLSSGTYTPEFSKRKLENIKPGSKITCWDFSRLYKKMINDLNENIEAVVMVEGSDAGHMSAGWYTDNASVMLDAINAGQTKKNDLMRVKQGLKVGGIKVISDKKGCVESALKKIYPVITKREPKSVNGLLNELRELSKQDTTIDLKTRLESFAEIMKREKMAENEATQSFKFYCLAGYFGDDFENTYIGKRIREDGKETYKRLILMRSKSDFKKNNEKATLYFLDTKTMEVSTSTAKEVAAQFKTKDLVYQDRANDMEGVGNNFYGYY